MSDLPDVTVAVEPELVDKPTACQMLGGISVDQLELYMRNGDITPKLAGKRVVFLVKEVRRFGRELPSWEPRKRAAS
jgi:hypothetical protein